MVERRTIILADDGRHVLVGRDSLPSEAEISVAASVLAIQGLGGWLASMDGHYHRRGAVVLTPIREIAAVAHSFSEATTAASELR